MPLVGRLIPSRPCWRRRRAAVIVIVVTSTAGWLRHHGGADRVDKTLEGYALSALISFIDSPNCEKTTSVPIRAG